MPKLTTQQRRQIKDLMVWIKDESGAASWAELARRADVLPSSLSDWVRGHNGPSAPNVVRLLRAAGVMPYGRAGNGATDHGPGASEDPGEELERAVDGALGALEAVRRELHAARPEGSTGTPPERRAK